MRGNSPGDRQRGRDEGHRYRDRRDKAPGHEPEFFGTQVYFEDAQFTGGEVSFEGAQFSGGTVDLSDVGDWSFPPVHPWTVAQPAGVKLPHTEPGFLRKGAAAPQSKQPGK